MRRPTAMPHHPLADFQNVKETYAQADVVHDLVGVFRVDLVFQRVQRGLSKVFGVDDDEVCEGRLEEKGNLVRMAGIPFLREREGGRREAN